jgi:TonB family protein
MYFDFEDHRPDIARVERAISWREGLLLSIIMHLLLVIAALSAPDWLVSAARTPREQAIVEPPPRESTRFVFVQPRLDPPAPKVRERAEASDQDRLARQLERAATPTNPLPFSRGNTTERVERSQASVARGRGPEPTPQVESVGEASAHADVAVPPVPESTSALRLPPTSTRSRSLDRGLTGGGRLGDALRNLDRYVQPDQFANVQGDSGTFGPAIQFDTKGVEFGPWIRRFVAQVKRNWLIPYAAMTMHGRVVVTFNVHKDGTLTDLNVVGPCPIDAFNNAAYGALASSNPTHPLPPEYPTDRAFFTVTFFYNEQAP